MANKASRTIQEQIELLDNRGMLFHDKAFATACLKRISYFRLKAYWWDMQSDPVNHVFTSESCFEDVIERYEFDNALRKILFTAIDTIEIALRTKLTNEFGLSIHSDLSSWLEAIAYLRNIVAHHSRLWSRNMVKRPSEPLNPHNTWLSRQLSDMEAKRPFYIITAMLYLCDAVHPSNKLREDIFQLMKEYAHLPVQRMGFFDGWEQEPIWATERVESMVR